MANGMKLIILFIVSLFWISSANAAEAELEWLPAINANGYRVYFGTDINDLDCSRDFGPAIKGTIPGLDCGKTYHFQVRAYNQAGNTKPSNTVTKTINPCPTMPEVPEGWEIDGLILKPKVE